MYSVRFPKIGIPMPTTDRDEDDLRGVEFFPAGAAVDENFFGGQIDAVGLNADGATPVQFAKFFQDDVHVDRRLDPAPGEARHQIVRADRVRSGVQIEGRGDRHGRLPCALTIKGFLSFTRARSIAQG